MNALQVVDNTGKKSDTSEYIKDDIIVQYLYDIATIHFTDRQLSNHFLQTIQRSD